MGLNKTEQSACFLLSTRKQHQLLNGKSRINSLCNFARVRSRFGAGNVRATRETNKNRIETFFCPFGAPNGKSFDSCWQLLRRSRPSELSEILHYVSIRPFATPREEKKNEKIALERKNTRNSARVGLTVDSLIHLINPRNVNGLLERGH